jgi:hypothetical protein
LFAGEVLVPAIWRKLRNSWQAASLEEKSKGEAHDRKPTLESH